MDFSTLFQDAVVQGVPLLLLIIGLVQFAKSVKLNGKGLSGDATRVFAYALSLSLGLGFEISRHGVPTDFANWFGFVVYGLAFGLAGTGLYDVTQPKTA